MTDPTPTRRRFQFSLRTLLVVVTICAVLLLSFIVPVRQEMDWIDEVTASTKHQTLITFGFEMTPLMKTTPVIKSSPLADWLESREGDVTYRWRFLSGPLETLWGTCAGHACGFGPTDLFLSTRFA